MTPLELKNPFILRRDTFYSVAVEGFLLSRYLGNKKVFTGWFKVEENCLINHSHCSWKKRQRKKKS